MKTNESKRTYLAFDVDGTIYDASAFGIEAFRMGLDEASRVLGISGMKIPTREEIISKIGRTTEEIYGSFFSQLNEGQVKIVGDCCTASFVRLIRERQGKLIDGVEEVLPRLKAAGYPFLTASNGRREYVRAIFETHNLTDFFDEASLYCEGDIENKIQILARYKKALSADDLIIMIGDRTPDKQAAKENDIPFIGCAFGLAAEEVSGEPFAAKTFFDLPALINKIEKEYERG